MSPCSPNDVSFPSPSGPSAPSIPGFGLPFQIPVPSIGLPDGFPEDLLKLLNTLQLLIPPGALKPALNPNFGKNIFDCIMKLLDQFMPFLMLYKFFLPFLNIVICIIEVLCSLVSPFAVIAALNKLFTQCIPAFLNLFPIFALIIMIISLLLLLLALIEFIINEIIKFIKALLRNINALVKAFQNANANSVSAIAKKLGALLCIFQNIFVLLSIFGIIIQIIKDILSLGFSIPPCESSGPGSIDGCCSPTTCPTIVQAPFTENTGVLQYLPQIGYIITGIPALAGGFDLRPETWQIYDPNQSIPHAFWNIVDGYDISPTVIPKPIFFPTDSNYTATTSPQQSAYTVNLRLLYNPGAWGRPGPQEYIRFNNCIVLAAPTQKLLTYNGQTTPVPNGVLYLAGGVGYLDDGVTKLFGFQPNGTTALSPPEQATLENFLHKQAVFETTPVLLADGYTFQNATYTFTPNLPLLLQKNLVTAGCEPSLALNRAFVNNVVFANVAAQTADLSALSAGTFGTPPVGFPDPNGAQQCLLAAIAALRTNMTTVGVAEFQTTTTICLNKLRSDTNAALGAVIGIGFSPCNSNFTLSPDIQFTTQPIEVTVNLNEVNNISIAAGLPADIGASLADQIKAYQTFGDVSRFSYDGYGAFTAKITSDNPGTGSIMVAFQNQVLCTNVLPAAGTPSHTLQSLNYEFVYAPSANTQPRRDAGDTSRDGGSNGGD